MSYKLEHGCIKFDFHFWSEFWINKNLIICQITTRFLSKYDWWYVVKQNDPLTQRIVALQCHTSHTFLTRGWNLIHTILDSFHMYELSITLRINRSIFYLHSQVLIATKLLFRLQFFPQKCWARIQFPDLSKAIYQVLQLLCHSLKLTQ